MTDYETFQVIKRKEENEKDNTFIRRKEFLAKCLNCSLSEVRIKAGDFFDKYPDIPYKKLSEKDFNIFITEFKNKENNVSTIY